jgi:N-acetylglucosaminyldiphosphoundecaprenol N-acetyl-beta-D-mannosaminyltransferase
VDDQFHRALRACDDVVPDGVGVTLACRLAGLGKLSRITGFDVFKTIMLQMQRIGGRVFFFGSSNAVLALVESRVRHDYPNVHVTLLAPPFGDWSEEQEDALVREIRDARPDVLWVGMTAPRQEKWVHANINKLDIPVVGAIGAVFDYYAGTVRRAPSWYRQRGLEWLYRLLREPRRLWRRTVLSAPRFVWLVVRERLAAGN